MSRIKIRYVTTDCECPEYAKTSIHYCNSDCENCRFYMSRTHIQEGNYKSFEYVEGQYFKYGRKQIQVQSAGFLEYIEYLQIDNDILINDDETESEVIQNNDDQTTGN